MRLSKNDIYRMKKGDYIIIAAVLLFAAIAVIFIYCRKNGDAVVINDNDIIHTYSLNDDREIDIRNDSGEYNIIIIRNHSVWVEEASCKNQICVHHDAISKDGESIICVPNGVSVTVKADSKNDIDN